MNKKKLYLAGPITGLSYGEARHGWREEFVTILEQIGACHVDPASPMRGKDNLKHLKQISSHGRQPGYQVAVSSASGIVARDRYDVMTSEAIVANFLGARIMSGGTCIEFGWADAYRKPVIMVIEDDAVERGNPHEHLMLTGIAGYRVNNLEEAARLAALLLGNGI